MEGDARLVQRRDQDRSRDQPQRQLHACVDQQQFAHRVTRSCPQAKRRRALLSPYIGRISGLGRAAHAAPLLSLDDG
jgi:hypothetical protein